MKTRWFVVLLSRRADPRPVFDSRWRWLACLYAGLYAMFNETEMVDVWPVYSI